jgi:GxxExxY protein
LKNQSGAIAPNIQGSNLPSEGLDGMSLRELTYKINGAIFDVHRILGEGFLEKIYENALLIELRTQGLQAESQVPVPVFYKGHMVGDYIADLVVDNQIIIELKTVDELTAVHQAQLINYLRATEKPLGLLVNFKGKKATIRRLALNAES